LDGFFLSLINGVISMPFKNLSWLPLVVEINFYVAVAMVVLGSLLCISSASYFEFNEDLYGALDNNLRIIMVYLALTEVVVVTYCYVMKSFHYLILMGFFLLLMIGSMQFYGDINSVEVDTNFSLFLMYTGVSHIIFALIKKTTTTQPKKAL